MTEYGSFRTIQFKNNVFTRSPDRSVVDPTDTVRDTTESAVVNPANSASPTDVIVAPAPDAPTFNPPRSDNTNRINVGYVF